MKISSLERKRCMTYKKIKQLVIENAVCKKNDTIHFSISLQINPEKCPSTQKKGGGVEKGGGHRESTSGEKIEPN